MAAVDAINVALPLTVGAAIDGLIAKRLPSVLWAAGIYFVLMAFQAWGRYLWRIYLMGASHGVARDLRTQLYAHLQQLPLGYYQKVRTGDLMSRATNDVESVRMAVGPGVLVSSDAFFLFLMIMPVMFYKSWKLSLLAFAFYPMVPWLTAKIGDRIDKLFTDLQKKMSELSAFAQESFQGIRWIKSFVLEPRVAERFRELSADYRTEGVRLAKYEAVFSPALGFLTEMGTLLILIFGGREVMNGAITVGTFVAFQRYVVQLAWPMEAIGWSVTMHREGIAALRRIQEILKTEKAPETKKGDPPENHPGFFIKKLEFRYEASSRGISLSGLSLPPGRRVGVVGPVGSGKSTLFNLVLRLYDPPQGSLYWQGRDILEIPVKELRHQIASVEQQVFLFSEPIAQNISLGGAALSPEDLGGLVRTVEFDDELRSLPLGAAQLMGERGINLSGGQKQRIALARALARKPSLLLLDDCFSAVDVDLEHKIIRNLLHSHAHLSVCIATHRLGIMPFVDEIWVLNEGRLVDSGTHADLLKSAPLYRDLWEKSEEQRETMRETGAEVRETL